MSPNASWTFDPGAIVLVVVAGALYVHRWREARRVTGLRGARGWHLASFMSGLLCIVAALNSPIDRLSDQILTMHMVQHLLLLDIAPVLLVVGLTRVILRPVTRRLDPIERAAGPLGHPVFAVALYVGAMWLWHVPALYDAAVRHPAIHVLEHTTFMTAGALYWWHLLGPIPSRLRAGGMGPIAYMLVTKLLVGLLGIGLTFAPGSFYGYYAHHHHYWGLSGSTDQAVAGALMALEQSLVMGIALAWLFVRMLGESVRNDERAERYAG